MKPLCHNFRPPLSGRGSAGVVEVVDAGDSKSPGETRAGSSPASGTTGDARIVELPEGKKSQHLSKHVLHLSSRAVRFRASGVAGLNQLH